MNKLIHYICQNKMFIILLSVILIITIALGVYYVQNVMEPKQQETPQKEPVTDKDTDTSIASFQGSYDSKSKQIRLSWSIQKGSQNVTSLELYHKDNVLADVNSLNSYVLNQAVYQFPGGENVFILKGTLDDGSTIEKETRITIEYFASITCTTEDSENGTLVKLTYKYHQTADIQTPRIVANSLPYNYQFNFKETNKEEPQDGYITETTVFEIDSKDAATDETLTIRWIFDSIGMSYDFPVKIIGKGTAASKKE